MPTHSAETHGRQRALEIATVRFGLRDLSSRMLLPGRRDPIFELVNTVVNEVPGRKRAFSARRFKLIWSAGLRRRCRGGKRERWRGMRPSILALTIHRTVTTRRADFAVHHLTRRDRRAPGPRAAAVMMLRVAVHEECRSTCESDHRHSFSVVSDRV